MQYLDSLYIAAGTKAAQFKEKAGEKIRDFYSSEDGVSNVVATIIILLIVVIIIAVFWGRLSEWLGDIMDRIFGEKLPSKDDF